MSLPWALLVLALSVAIVMALRMIHRLTLQVGVLQDRVVFLHERSVTVMRDVQERMAAVTRDVHRTERMARRTVRIAQATFGTMQNAAPSTPLEHVPLTRQEIYALLGTAPNDIDALELLGAAPNDINDALDGDEARFPIEPAPEPKRAEPPTSFERVLNDDPEDPV